MTVCAVEIDHMRRQLSGLGRSEILWNSPLWLGLCYLWLGVNNYWLMRQSRHLADTIRRILGSVPQESVQVCAEELLAIAKQLQDPLRSILVPPKSVRRPAWLQRQLEEHETVWSDLIEDLALAADPECRQLFEQLAACAKRLR